MRPTAENVLFLHTVAVSAFGGSEGVRDPESLYAAVARPWGSSFGRDQFPAPSDKAAALAESIIRRQPFGCRLEADQQDLEDFAESVVEGGMDTERIARWFEGHSRKS